MRALLNKYTERKSNKMGINITELRRLKSELVEFLHENDNGFIVNEFFQGYDRFTNYIERLFNQSLSNHSKETIRVMAYVDQINKYDLEFMMKEI